MAMAMAEGIQFFNARVFNARRTGAGIQFVRIVRHPSLVRAGDVQLVTSKKGDPGPRVAGGDKLSPPYPAWLCQVIAIEHGHMAHRNSEF